MMEILKTFGSKALLLMAFLIFVTSCKSTKVVTEGRVNDKLTAKSVIKSHYLNGSKFASLNGRVKINYSDGESSQSVSVSLRMKKDEAIWLSAPLGIVKAYITPDRVSFYNKLENEYFDGDFSYLSSLLGTEVDFPILQNLLLGQAILDLRDEKYTIDIDEDTYRLTPKLPGSLYKILFRIEPKNFKMNLQQLSQPSEQRLLQIAYQNYQKIDNEILPNEIHIKALTKDSENTIKLEFRNIELNGAVNFPYSIPKGFKEIEL
ncbi:DUF4292 domain-containing protein [Maribacter confluentis]|uniref:DUF4292 domain-containing protein n=1 Tax=Maribacter confluentis TaxID=1656093 RepID=A0ABT8RQ78_9FLAO|nr:DUF4292 domain-containing protein [Maribacter confluentis]MDO1512985.1 DUF4292 domain-containing protein [Maribacter confluentis]